MIAVASLRPPPSRRVLIRDVHQIGVQTLEVDEEGRFFMKIKNRTYRSDVEVPIATARRYYHAMRKPGDPTTLTRRLSSA